MIAIVYPQFYGVGGIARYLDSFLANLPDNHPTIHVITGDENRLDKHFKNVQFIHLPFSANRFNLIFWSLKARKILNQLYAQQKIQCINLHIPPLISGLFMPNRIPLILTAHTTYRGMSGRFYSTKFYTSQWCATEINFKLWVEQRLFSQASKVICLTEQGKQEFHTYDVKRPVVVIPNGVDTDLFQINHTAVKDIDILFCGRIEHRKGSRSMVEACIALMQKKNDIKILIVGYGDDDFWVSAQLSAYTSNITLTGKVSFTEMQQFYARSRLYVSTSYYEGLPGTCLEAMAMGVPVIVWNFLFYKDLIEHGKTGFLIEPNNIEKLVTEAVRVLNDAPTRLQVATNARAHAENKYNWKNLSSEIFNHLNINK